MKLRKLFLKKYSMFGDCEECNHSFAYHMPLAGCIKCDCSEFH